MKFRRIIAASLACALVASASGLVLAQQPYFRVTTPSGTGQSGGTPPGQEPNNPGQTLILDFVGARASEGMVGQPLTAFAFSVDGGKAPYDISLTGLDEFNVNGTQVFGTPLVSGNRSFELTAIDADGERRTLTGSLDIHPQFSASMNGTPPASMVMGTPIATVRIVPSGGKLPYTFGTTGTFPADWTTRTASCRESRRRQAPTPSA